MTAPGGSTAAQVVSAVPLREDQLSALRELLNKKLDKTVTLSPRVDPALLGGLWIYVDGHVIDRSLKKQLRDITESIKKGGSG